MAWAWKSGAGVDEDGVVVVIEADGGSCSAVG